MLAPNVFLLSNAVMDKNACLKRYFFRQALCFISLFKRFIRFWLFLGRYRSVPADQ